MFNQDKEIIEKKVVIETNAITALCIISQIQLACRHPGNTGISRQTGEAFARELQQQLSELVPDWSVVLEMGWNPDYDM